MVFSSNHRLSRDKKFFGQSAALVARAIAACILAISDRQIGAPTRQQRPVVRARRIAIYLAHVSLSQKVQILSASFHRHPSTLRRACAAIEDARDNNALDWCLDLLETALQAHAQSFCAGPQLQEVRQ